MNKCVMFDFSRLGRSRSYRQHDMARGAMLPSEAAKGKPLVHFFWLLRTPSAVNQPLWMGSHASRLLRLVDGGHYGARTSAAETAMLRLWIDSGAAYPGTYAALGCGMVGVGLEPAVLNRRCVACHAARKIDADLGFMSGRAFNLTRPERSLALLAPLAPAAGADRRRDWNASRRNVTRTGRKTGVPEESFRGVSVVASAFVARGRAYPPRPPQELCLRGKIRIEALDGRWPFMPC